MPVARVDSEIALWDLSCAINAGYKKTREALGA